MDILLPTKFAPAERINQQTINSQRTSVENYNNLNLLFSSLPFYILLLNKQRQIVYANKPFLNLIKSDTIYGQRPGECIGCIHAFDEPTGCGTSEYCIECGAVNAILQSYTDENNQQECRLTKSNNEVMDLSIWSKKILIDNYEYTLFSFRDISDEKRKEVLERIFFHDVLNTASSLKNFVGLIKDSKGKELDDYLEITENISNKLIDEIISQRTLTQAENGELQLEFTNISTKEILEEVILLYKNHSVAIGKEILIQAGSSDIIIKTDKTILRRILSNLTKNAFEACNRNETVLIGCKNRDSRIEFNVKNPNYIPKDIQLQIFQRSFSTKSSGRGIGTYSIKLLTEKYLNGIVKFSSTIEFGTTFTVSYYKNTFHENYS